MKRRITDRIDDFATDFSFTRFMVIMLIISVISIMVSENHNREAERSPQTIAYAGDAFRNQDDSCWTNALVRVRRPDYWGSAMGYFVGSGPHRGALDNTVTEMARGAVRYALGQAGFSVVPPNYAGPGPTWGPPPGHLGEICVSFDATRGPPDLVRSATIEGTTCNGMPFRREVPIARISDVVRNSI